MNLTTIAKIDKNLNNEFKKSGDKERYALVNLFNYLTTKQEDYSYNFAPSDSGVNIGFDGILTIKYKNSGTIAGYYIIEAKVRTQHYDQLIFEKAKMNTLKKYKRQYDKYFKTNFSDKTIGILYVNFTPQASYIFDICTIEENNLLPKLTKKEMNKVTVASREDKINKQIYLLNLDLGIKYKYIFNEEEYTNSLFEEAQSKLNIVNEIKKTTYVVSLF